MLAVATVSASLEVPRIAHEPLHATAFEIADASSAMSSAVKELASTVTASHVGFDTNVYPGDRAMDAWKRSGEYEWVGYYLQAPCHKDTSWSGKRAHLVNNGWGLAVLYVGQQTWGQTSTTASAPPSRKLKRPRHGKKSRVTRTMTRRSTKPVAAAGDRCSASYVGATQGRLDARDAIATAAKEAFPSGTVVFLDIEYMDVLPQRMRDYYMSWAKSVLADGRYRPGIYAHTHNAAQIYDDVSDIYAQAGVDTEPPFWVAGSSGFSPGSVPTDVGHAFASAWQGLLDVVRTHNGVRLPIDISVASVASPSLATVQ